MVAEVVHHRHAARDAAHFHPPFDAFEGVERGLDLMVFQPAMLGAGDDRQRVAHVEFAHQVQVEFEAGNLKFGGRRAVAEVKGADSCCFRPDRNRLHRAMRHVQQRRKVRVVAVAQQQAVARNQPDEMREGFFDRVQIFKNVRVIEFEVVDDGDFRQVMDELAALVEKRRVVFVALDDEPFAVGEPRALAEIVRNAADEIARIQPIVLEHPRQQRSRGGFAMRAGDDDGAFAANEKFLEQLRQRAITQFVIEHELGFRVAAGNRVADDHEVGFMRKFRSA